MTFILNLVQATRFTGETVTLLMKLSDKPLLLDYD
jgi:hypothetical protein